jgi:hypothetical protein
MRRGPRLRPGPPCPSSVGGDTTAHFELRGLELGQVPSRLGLLPGAKDWVNDDMLRFFWGEQVRRLAVCMLHHRLLGRGITWSEIDGEILQMVLSYPTCHSSTWEAEGGSRKGGGRGGGERGGGGYVPLALSEYVSVIVILRKGTIHPSLTHSLIHSLLPSPSPSLSRPAFPRPSYLPLAFPLPEVRKGVWTWERARCSCEALTLLFIVRELDNRYVFCQEKGIGEHFVFLPVIQACLSSSSPYCGVITSTGTTASHGRH